MHISQEVYSVYNSVDIWLFKTYFSPFQMTQKTVKKSPAYSDWLKRHAQKGKYLLQLSKCEDSSCCQPIPAGIQKPTLLPHPKFDDSGEHYVQYSQMAGTGHISQPPSSQATTGRTRNQTVTKPPFPLTSQTARTAVYCVECLKGRVVYCKKRLGPEENRALTQVTEQYDFSCGATLFPEGHALRDIVLVRPLTTCATLMEVMYYKPVPLGPQDMCCHCGEGDGVVPAELQLKFKTVLPICEDCSSAGKEAYTAYAKPAKK